MEMLRDFGLRYNFYFYLQDSGLNLSWKRFESQQDFFLPV